MKICNGCVWLKKQKKVHSYICFNSDSKFRKAPFPHGKTRTACNLYEPRNPPVSLQSVPKNMRLIEDLRGKEEFKNSNFWIIGSDSNLDYYPGDFFDDKFSITVNLSCVAFPRSTFFYISGKKQLEWMISKYPDCLKKVILPLATLKFKFSAKAKREILKCHNLDLTFRDGIGYWENWGLEPIYMKSGNRPGTKSVPDYESTVQRILSNDPCEFALVRTSAHSCIFAAAVLGAKKIILVGCSHKDQKGKVYAHKRGMGNHISEAIEKKLKNAVYSSRTGVIERMRRDTIQLAKVFKNYGIEVIRHRYDEEKQGFIFEEIEGT